MTYSEIYQIVFSKNVPFMYSGAVTITHKKQNSKGYQTKLKYYSQSQLKAEGRLTYPD